MTRDDYQKEWEKLREYSIMNSESLDNFPNSVVVSVIELMKSYQENRIVPMNTDDVSNQTVIKYKEELDKDRDNSDSVVISARSYSKMIDDFLNLEQSLVEMTEKYNALGKDYEKTYEMLCKVSNDPEAKLIRELTEKTERLTEAEKLIDDLIEGAECYIGLGFWDSPMGKICEEYFTHKGESDGRR